MSKILIGKNEQREKDFDKIIENIYKRQKEIVGKVQTKFNIFDSEKRKYKLKMLAILYTTYLSTLGSIKDEAFSIEDLNLIKSLSINENINNNFISVINAFQDNNMRNVNSNKDLYESNMLKMDKKKSDLKLLAKKSEREIKEAGRQIKKDSCIFCTETFEENGGINPQISECKKYVHGKCFIKYIEEELNNNRFPIRCPLCINRHEINYKTIIDCLLLNDKNNLAIKLENISLNYLAQNNSDEITFCPTAGCRYMCFYDEKGYHLNCPICKKEYCLQCKTGWHYNLTCEEYQKVIKEKKENEDDVKFEEYVKGSKLKQCPNCKRWVEKISGCDHIRCSCGIDFCYRCGKMYDPQTRTHFCEDLSTNVSIYGDSMNIEESYTDVNSINFVNINKINVNDNIEFGNNNNNQRGILFGNNDQNLNLFNNINTQNNNLFNNNSQISGQFVNNNNSQENSRFNNFNNKSPNLFNNNNNQNLFGKNTNINFGANSNNQNNQNFFGKNNNYNNNVY